MPRAIAIANGPENPVALRVICSWKLLPSEAGRVARDAGAQRLLLTHVPLPDGGKWAMAEAATEFEGPLEIAEPLRTYEV